MKCSICECLVDTDDFPSGLYSKEEGFFDDFSGKPYDCLCNFCWDDEHRKRENSERG
jgi:hypothetical protein